jgi:hypothetical protein
MINLRKGTQVYTLHVSRRWMGALVLSPNLASKQMKEAPGDLVCSTGHLGSNCLHLVMRGHPVMGLTLLVFQSSS